MSKGRFARPAVAVPADDAEGSKEWELRPGGMVVQLRDPNLEAALAGPMIRLKVSYGMSVHEVYIAAHSSFGDLKKALVHDTGLHPQQQRILYKGKEKSNSIYLHEVGVKDKSKITLVEDTASREKRLLELRKNEALAKACKAVADVKQEVEKLAEQVLKVEAAVRSGKKLADSEFAGPIELLMCQLLKLDGIKAEGDAKMQRRILIRRVQKYVETLDALKARSDVPKQKPKPASDNVVTTTWETFDTGFGSLIDAPPPSSTPAVTLTTNWELFN